MTNCFAQVPEDFGYRHFSMKFKGDAVDILVKSKKGDEQKAKPLFLFCQGSLPIPLLVLYEKDGRQASVNPFVFDSDSLAVDYHLAIVGKPHVPLLMNEHKLEKDFTFKDSTQQFPAGYIQRNLLDDYVTRNIAVIDFLLTQKWVSKQRVVVAGHSEGSTIAAKMAVLSKKITHVIYSGGNPLGRMLSVIERQRAVETAGSKRVEEAFQNWSAIVADSTGMDGRYGDTHKASYQFSIPPINYLLALKIPVLVCYGTKDSGSPFNDYLRMETIRRRRQNFSFNAYAGTEHNYFPVTPTGEVDYNVFNWNTVAGDWRSWLQKQK